MRKNAIQYVLKYLSVFILTLGLLSYQGCCKKANATNITNNQFLIDFIDVGQGDAVLVQCDGHYMLVDGGDSKQSSRIYTILKNRGISYLDVMVASHPDADHIGGLSGALNYAKVGIALSPVSKSETKTFQSFVKYLDAQGVSITVPRYGDKFMLGSASVSVLGPVSLSSDDNNNSIILRIIYGETSFLLTGDAETEEETSVLNSRQTVKSTVLKVAHHGSNSSSGYRFIREVAPQYAVISVGKGNKYGHPTENVLSRLRDAEVETYRTDMQGDITCISDGKVVSFSVRKNPDADTLAVADSGQRLSAADATGLYRNNNSDVIPEGVGTTDNIQNKTLESVSTECSYVLNKNTDKFHYPYCNSVSQMKEKNKVYYKGSREDVIAQGYSPCKNCNP